MFSLIFFAFGAHRQKYRWVYEDFPPSIDELVRRMEAGEPRIQAGWKRVPL